MNTFKGVRIRRHNDGSLWVNTRDPEVIEYMDKNYKRQRGQLRWFPTLEHTSPLDSLKDKFQGRVCWIIGKSPVLDLLTKEHLKDKVVICLNEAVLRVQELITEDVFSLWQDASVKEHDIKVSLILNREIQYFYAKQDRYVFQDSELGFGKMEASSIAAVKLAEYFGCTDINLVACDGCFGRDTTYAASIKNQSSYPRPEKYLEQGVQLRKMNVTIKRKEDILKPSSDTPSLWSERQTERYGGSHSKPSKNSQDTSDSV